MAQIQPTFPPTPPSENNETKSSTSSFTLDGLISEPRVIIAVVGQTGTGKTTFINTASGSNLTIGDGLDSCTGKVEESKQFELDGRLVTLIDTPGFDDSEISDVDVLDMIATFLCERYQEKVMLAGVIYMHRISDVRMGGTSKRNFTMFQKLCGENALQNVVIVTTMWGEVPRGIGESRETELEVKFRAVLEKGATMIRHEGREDVNSANRILRCIIENDPLPLQIQKELVDQKKELGETLAGEEVNRELVMKIAKRERDMKRVWQELQEAKNREAKQELEQLHKRHAQETRKLKAEIEKLKGKTSLWWVLGAAAVGVGAGAVLVPAGAAAAAAAAAAALVAEGIAAAGAVAAGISAQSVVAAAGVAAASVAVAKKVVS